MTLPTDIIPDNDQTRARRVHLERIRALVGNAYPNGFARSSVTATPEGEDTISSIVGEYGPLAPPKNDKGERPTAEEIQRACDAIGNVTVRLSGRLATPPRVMGKAAFVHLSDGRERLQIYVRRGEARAVSNDTGEVLEDAAAGWELFGLLDHGDFAGVEGTLFVTRTGELSVQVRELQFLAKALLPMPDKLHGVSDPEIRQRQRYVDLIAGSLKVEKDKDEKDEGPTEGGDVSDGATRELSTREVFERRSRMITEMRRYLDDHGYIEVETPMLSPIASGAAARPFETFHNTLGIKLYARIAPELYLKRLVVGGFERVYELNRNFRNEGIGYRWNPEFTMLEFYCAYMDAGGMMDFCEALLRRTIESVTGTTVASFGEHELDFGRPFERMSMREAVERFGPGVVITDANLVELFETHAEPHLTQPVFIIDFPKAVSPLSKASPEDASIAERFELFVAGMEIANGFSELNDPVEQYERFLDQTRQRERGDEEAMRMDEDYVRALAYGMPPAAGIGIGVDRLAMLLTNRRSIRDVILFPHMRPRTSADETAAADEKAEVGPETNQRSDE